MERTLTLAARPPLLIINADDLGVSPERDAGIFDCFTAGAISSASLLVDGVDAEAAARRAVELDLPLGLHLNLTEFRLAPPSSLTDADGNRLGKHGLRAALAAGRVAEADLVAEIRRQFDRFIALTGELPSHVDGHHHIHVEPHIAAALAPIMAREYGVYCVRLPREHGLDARAADTEFEADFQRGVAKAAAAAAPVFAAAGIYSTGAFLGQSSMGTRLSAAGIRAQLAALPAGTSVELMVHPGRCAEHPDAGAFCRSPARAREASVLQSAEFRALHAGRMLASYRELCRPDDDGRPTLLIYGKLTPATGNAETARRYAEAWRDRANVRFRALPPLDTPAQLAREARRLQETAHRERLDLALGIHLYRAGTPLAAAFADAATTPLAYGLLASGTDANADIGDDEKRAAMQTAVRHAGFVLCLTEDMRRRLAGLTLPALNVVLPNGIEVNTASTYSLRRELQLPDKAPLILFPAALRRLKGVLPTIEALAPLLATRFTDHVLVVMGPVLEAGYAAMIRSRIAALVAAAPTLSGRLVLHAGLPRDDYLAALREASLVVNSSDHEGLSHALAEAMAAGIPVLARDIPGNRDLVQDGGDRPNGRLFADFATLPQRYAECFDNAVSTAELAVTARDDIARRFPPDAEQAVLRDLLETTLAQRQVRLGDLRLELAPGTHPVSAENLALFEAIAASPDLPPSIPLACDIGCGCGVFGIALLRALARDGRSVERMLFTDPHRPSLAALARTLLRHDNWPHLPRAALLDDGSLLEPLLARGEQATLICANLPQTPGPTEFRLDRCGGRDGADLLCALLEDLPRALAPGGEAFLLYISLAHPARVAAALATIGFKATELAMQVRAARFADYEALHPGLADYLRDEHAAGHAEFDPTPDGEGFRFRARLLRLRRKVDEEAPPAADARCAT